MAGLVADFAAPIILAEVGAISAEIAAAEAVTTGEIVALEGALSAELATAEGVLSGEIVASQEATAVEILASTTALETVLAGHTISLAKLQQSTVKNAINSLKNIKTARKIGIGISAITAAFALQAAGAKEGSSLAFDDMVLLIKYTFEFIKTHMVCGVFFAKNIRQCILYYVIDAIFQIIYLPIRIFKFFFYVFTGSTMLDDAEKGIVSILDKIDTVWFTFTKFHFLYWPKQVRDDCYNCKRLKVSALGSKARDVADDFTNTLPGMFTRGFGAMHSAMEKLKNPFNMSGLFDFSEITGGDVGDILQGIFL